MIKNLSYTDAELINYFKDAPNFALDEKIRWYRFVLIALELANEEQKSKPGKRFRYDVKKHKLLVGAIDSLLHEQSSIALEDISRASDIMPKLKMECQQLRSAIMMQLDKLCQEYLLNNNLFEQENSFRDNPIASHSEIIKNMGTIPLSGLSEEDKSLIKQVHNQGCERLYKVCKNIEQEILLDKVSPIRAAWLTDLIAMNSEEIEFVFGNWRLLRILCDLKNLYLSEKDDPKSISEKDKAMLEELAEFHGYSEEDYDESDESETSSSEHHDCQCCDEHEQQP